MKIFTLKHFFQNIEENIEEVIEKAHQEGKKQKRNNGLF